MVLAGIFVYCALADRSAFAEKRAKPLLQFPIFQSKIERPAHCTIQRRASVKIEKLVAYCTPIEPPISTPLQLAEMKSCREQLRRLAIVSTPVACARSLVAVPANAHSSALRAQAQLELAAVKIEADRANVMSSPADDSVGRTSPRLSNASGSTRRDGRVSTRQGLRCATTSGEDERASPQPALLNSVRVAALGAGAFTSSTALCSPHSSQGAPAPDLQVSRGQHPLDG
jgi:hypothetical protein